MITIENLSKSYGDKTILHDINLHFEKGKVYGIVGKNGAGKTTLFRCLAGLEPHAGKIKSKYDNIKNHLGFLETNPDFMSRVTGWEYLKLFCIARNIKTDDFESQNIFELPLKQYAETYSTGMKKKLAILAILLQKNDIYILDEPFNGVDIQSNIIIIELIRTLRQQGKTIIIASHIFSTLKDSCDNIILLDEGKIKNTVSIGQFDKLEDDMKSLIITDSINNLRF